MEYDKRAYLNHLNSLIDEYRPNDKIYLVDDHLLKMIENLDDGRLEKLIQKAEKALLEGARLGLRMSKTISQADLDKIKGQYEIK